MKYFIPRTVFNYIRIAVFYVIIPNNNDLRPSEMLCQNNVPFSFDSMPSITLVYSSVSCGSKNNLIYVGYDCLSLILLSTDTLFLQPRLCYTALRLS